jgi:hypothetical protein
LYLFFIKIGINLKKPELIFWSYSEKENNLFSLLKEGCTEFGESGGRTTEPDLIIKDENNLVFIEAKYLSPNKSLDDKVKREHITIPKNIKQVEMNGLVKFALMVNLPIKWQFCRINMNYFGFG